MPTSNRFAFANRRATPCDRRRARRRVVFRKHEWISHALPKDVNVCKCHERMTRLKSCAADKAPDNRSRSAAKPFLCSSELFFFFLPGPIWIVPSLSGKAPISPVNTKKGTVGFT